MLKKSLIFIVLLVISATSLKAAATTPCSLPTDTTNQTIVCDPSLQKILSSIQSLPSGNKLLREIQKEGTIQIVSRRANLAEQFGAFWDPTARVIVINALNERFPEKIIQSIVFECHNALMTKKLDELAQLAALGKISRDQYVRSVEYIEFCNSHQAAKLVEEGIRQGIFPEKARLPTYPTFQQHFYIQQMAGHSQWIAETYDRIRQTAQSNQFY